MCIRQKCKRLRVKLSFCKEKMFWAVEYIILAGGARVWGNSYETSHQAELGSGAD
jgi:hypothetical protein